MMRQYELVERVLRYAPEADESLLNRAYVYAMKAHGHQKRASGDPYFSHPLEVAAILTDLKLDDATIATALLHDVIEDTEATRSEIDRLFGPKIGALVDGLTKIKKLDLVSKKTEHAENFRKLLVAISSDIRVLLVKMADRLHNMRTIEHMKPASRLRISQETLDIYAPLAGRMGMQSIRDELEDHAFRWLQPDAYKTVTDRLQQLRKRNAGLVNEIQDVLVGSFEEAGIKTTVIGREKRPYSIWRKMENRQISLEQLSDIYGFRTIVDTVDTCYRALGVVHAAWPAVPGRFKDYISTPKQNGYRSIHTTVVGPRHQRVELQIRTREMHEIAEYGVAAHALYKDGISAGPLNGNGRDNPEPYAWLRRLVDTLVQGDNSEEFLEHAKLELFQDQVFCFTPKGRLIALPRGATPIDFAYAVHTDVGNACVGAIINGRQMPVSSVLRNGDEVEILMAPGQSPPPAWEQAAITGKARSAIRRAAREARRKQYGELGRRLLSQALQRLGASYSDERIRAVLPRLPHGTLEDLLAAVGRGEQSIKEILSALDPGLAPTKAPASRPRNRFQRGQGDEGWFNLKKVIGLKFRWPGAASESDARATTGAIPIRGLRNDIPVSFEEGGAVPGDRIVGVLIEGEGIRIFQIHSPRLKDYEHERWIDVTFDVDPDTPERFPARIRVTALNEPGSLARIAQVAGEADGNIDNLRMVKRGADFTEMLIEVEVFDLAHLNQILVGLRTLPVVSVAERSFE